MSKEEAADDLREQAASCRRLALRARTKQGASALTTLANQLDGDAGRMDPLSLPR